MIPEFQTVTYALKTSLNMNDQSQAHFHPSVFKLKHGG